MENNKDRFVRLKEVMQRTGLGRSTIYSRLQEGTFPRQIKLGKRTVVWSETDISNWIEEQKQKEGTI